MTTRWLFGDQLGPHFVDDHRGPLLMVESLGVFRRRRFHRAKAHLVLSAMRHRAAELGDRLTYVRAETYAEVVRELRRRRGRPPDVVRRPGPGRTPRGERPAAARVRHGTRGLRALGRGPRRQAAADGGLLPSRPARPRRAAGRRRAGRREVELRPRQPPAAAEGRRDARRHRAVVAHRGRHRRRGARGPRPVGARRRDRDDRSRRSAALPRDPARGAGRARPLRRAPAAGVRRPRGRDPRGRPVDGAQPRQRTDEPRPPRPARGGGAGGDGVPQRGRADRERRGVRAPGDRLARLRLAPLLAPGRRLPPRERAARHRADAAVVRRARRRRDGRALPVPHPRPGRRARLGPPHPAADGARARTPCSAAGRRPRSPTGSTGPSSTATTG